MGVGDLLKVLLFLVGISPSKSMIVCGNYLCTGIGAYCCGLHCCSSIWTFWWFWMLWVVLFTCLGSCGWWCGRRYRERRAAQAGEYLIVSQPSNQSFNQPGYYGAVSAPPYAAQAPPYSATEAKPPAYNENKQTAPPPSYM